jgi:hypothetical protein
VFGDTRQHARGDFFTVVKRANHIGHPARENGGFFMVERPDLHVRAGRGASFL